MTMTTAEPTTALSQSGKQTLTRLAGTSTLIIASVAILIVGILIGNAARKRIDRLSHGISLM
jgi:hypothetical protein